MVAALPAHHVLLVVTVVPVAAGSGSVVPAPLVPAPHTGLSLAVADKRGWEQLLPVWLHTASGVLASAAVAAAAGAGAAAPPHLVVVVAGHQEPDSAHRQLLLDVLGLLAACLHVVCVHQDRFVPLPPHRLAAGHSPPRPRAASKPAIRQAIARVQTLLPTVQPPRQWLQSVNRLLLSD